MQAKPYTKERYREQSANGRPATDWQGCRGCVSRQRTPLAASVACAHVSTAVLSPFPLHPFTAHQLTLRQILSFLSSGFPSLVPGPVTNVCEPELSYLGGVGGGDAGGGGSGSRLRAALGDRVPLAPPLVLCGSGSADSLLTFLFAAALPALCFPLRVTREATLPANRLNRFLPVFVRGGFAGLWRKCGCEREGTRGARRRRARGSRRRRRRLQRRGERTEAAPEAVAEPMPRDGGRARRDKSGARGMSPGPP
ncbi:uncharacterized protein LOC123624217 [Lemur catta]|uniref:uncharacterized protein LOC123624217 n=1 Tax=Lemur catta TaxID=9447 RepID=UPI001E26D617|nr:uncharacterized protein LOC123624217 [Lemur catta]